MSSRAADEKLEAPWHTLAEDLGASCIDFLSIQEQCAIVRTSTRVHRFARNAARRPHGKGVIRRPHRMMGVQPNRTLMEMIKAVGTACPKVERFFVSVVSDVRPTELKPEPIVFFLGEGKHEVQDIIHLPCARNLTRLDTCVSPWTSDGVVDALSYFPRLQTLSVKTFWHIGGAECDFAVRMAPVFNRVPELILTLWYKPCESCLGKLRQLKNLHALNFDWSIRMRARPSDVGAGFEAMIDIVNFLPDWLTTVTFTVRACERRVEEWQYFLRKVSARVRARFTTWNASMSVSTVFFDSELGHEAIVDDDRKFLYQPGRLQRIRKSTATFGDHVKQLRLTLCSSYQ